MSSSSSFTAVCAGKSNSDSSIVVAELELPVFILTVSSIYASDCRKRMA